MPWHTSFPPDIPILEARFSGVLTSAELTVAAEETLRQARRSGRMLLLADCSTLDAGGHSITDLYFLADTVSKSDIGGELKEAVLLPVLPASAEQVEFWENACFNRGVKVRIFTSRQEALGWLLGEQEELPAGRNKAATRS